MYVSCRGAESRQSEGKKHFHMAVLGAYYAMKETRARSLTLDSIHTIGHVDGDIDHSRK